MSDFTVAAQVGVAQDMTVAGGEAAISWQSETVDRRAVHDTATNPDRFTAPVRGVYAVTGMLEISTDTDNTTYVVKIAKNGTAVQSLNTAKAVLIATPAIVPFSGAVFLEAGEYVSVKVLPAVGAGKLTILAISSIVVRRMDAVN